MSGDEGQPNWDHFLQHSSALGILRPDAVFDVFNIHPELPRSRLLRTTHTEDGLSVFASDDLLMPVYPTGPGGMSFAVADQKENVPVTFDRQIHGGGPHIATFPRCPPLGALFVLSDIPPQRTIQQLHRTQTMDYVVVLLGEVVLCLDGGEEKTVRAGDLVVQQGTSHAWVNRSAEPCRILSVKLGSEKIVLADGTELEESL